MSDHTRTSPAPLRARPATPPVVVAAEGPSMKALRVAVVPYAEALGLRVVPVRPAPPACPYHRVRCLPAQSRCSGGFAFYNITCAWSWGRDACAPAPLDRCTTQPWVWL